MFVSDIHTYDSYLKKFLCVLCLVMPLSIPPFESRCNDIRDIEK